MMLEPQQHFSTGFWPFCTLLGVDLPGMRASQVRGGGSQNVHRTGPDVQPVAGAGVRHTCRLDWSKAPERNLPSCMCHASWHCGGACMQAAACVIHGGGAGHSRSTRPPGFSSVCDDCSLQQRACKQALAPITCAHAVPMQAGGGVEGNASAPAEQPAATPALPVTPKQHCGTVLADWCGPYYSQASALPPLLGGSSR